jgi:hypothetical protein
MTESILVSVAATDRPKHLERLTFAGMDPPLLPNPPYFPPCDGGRSAERDAFWACLFTGDERRARHS